MSTIFDWSLTASSNGNADSAINWQEGQLPSSVNDSARQMMTRVAQLLKDVGGTVAAGGTANAITVTSNSPIASYTTGQTIGFKASATNTGAATLSVNAVGAKAIRKNVAAVDTALTGGEILSGGIYVLVYDAALNAAAGGWLLTNPSLLNQQTDIASAATTDIGAVGSENLRVTGTTTITDFGTAPAGTFRRLRFSGILTLTHNATSLILPGAANITTAAGDIAEFVSEGSGNWRCVDYTRASGSSLTQQFTTTYDSGDQTITAAGLLTLTHGLGKKPFGVQLKLKCTTAERGYAIGDEIEIAAGFTDSAATSRGASVYTQSSDATTTLYVRYGSNANTFNLLDKGTGAISNITNANWRLIVKAWA